jgi:hypothetical protein
LATVPGGRWRISARVADGSTGETPDELARRYLAALSAADGVAASALVHPEVEIHTARTVHRGRKAAVAWAGKTFDYLERRYVPREIEVTPEGLRVHAWLQYVWRESGEIGDSSPVVIELGLREGLISTWRLHEELEAPEAG